MAVSGSGRVALTDLSVTANRVGGVATAAYKLGADGRITTRRNAAAAVDQGAWVSPSATTLAALYETQATVLTGAVTSGTTGSWLALNADREWVVEASAYGLEYASLLIEVRLASSGAVVTSATIQLEANYA